MREINVQSLTDAIAALCIKANRTLSPDLEAALCTAKSTERLPLARANLQSLQDNLAAARQLTLPICQDTGMAVVFLDVGQDVHFVGGDLWDAVNAGVAKGYTQGYLRKSVVSDPLERMNTGDNTPAVLHTRIVSGSDVTITVAPKGFGSENMSRIGMLKPAQGEQGVYDFVLETISMAGPNACPPVVVGVGVGGTFEMAALLAKRALCRSADSHNPIPRYAQLEKRLLTAANQLNIGPGGFGGDTSALAVLIEAYATHIAGLPVAVNLSCHVTRHAQTVL